MRVLLVDLSEVGLSSVSALLHQAEDSICLEQGTDFDRAVARLVGAECDVGLVAHTSQSARGLELIRQAIAGGCRLPLLLLAEHDDPELDRAALEAGAAGFLVRDGLTVRKLVHSLRYARAAYDAGNRRSSELLDRFARHLSHEGKNALAGIRAGLSVLGSHLDPDGAHADIHAEMQSRLASLHEALEELDLFVRPLHPALSRLQLTEVIREVAETVVAEAERDARIEVTGPDVEARGDAGLLRRLFEAILRNAVEALPEGAQRVRLSLSVEGDHCQVEVRDGGLGLRLDTEAALQPFMTTKPRAAGLGLPIACRIAQAHQGTLELRSVPEGGVVVHVTLPVEGAPADGS